MTDYPGFTDSRTTVLDVYSFLPGKDKGLSFPPDASANGVLLDTYAGADDLVAGPALTFPTPMNDYPSTVRFDATPGIDWFERIHIFPRAKIDFGNIITQVDNLFELFSAFRHANATLQTITNHASPGITLPDMPATPVVREPFTSFLGPTSTPLNPVKEIVRALRDGLPVFDAAIDFAFADAEVVYLRVKGKRIAFVPVFFDGDVTETLEWNTDVIEKISGTNPQGISIRKNPRQFIEATLFLEDRDRRVLQMLIMDWHARLFAVPVWMEQMTLKVAVTGGTTNVVTVDSTANVDLRVGGLAAVFHDNQTYDVLKVTGKTGTTVTFESNVAASYSVNDLVVPVGLMHAQPLLSGERHAVTVERVRFLFRAYDNDTGVPTGDASGFSSYLGKVFLDDFNFLDGETTQEQFERRITVIDNSTGIVYQDSPWSVSKRGWVKGFVVNSRADLFKIRRLLYALRGRQISFYGTSFIDDLVVVANLVSGTATMQVENDGYTRFVQSRQPKNHVRILFNDGQALFREVLSSVENSATIETLTLDANWPDNRLVSEINRVEFLETVKLETDSIQIQHSSIVGKARIFLPVKTHVET